MHSAGSMASVRKVLVVGGGIAGLTAGAALAQRGIAADIVELQAVHSVFGVGLIQPGNALRALDALGVRDECMKAGFQSDTLKYFDNHEHELAELCMLRIASPDLPAANFLARADLHHILTGAALKAGATLALGVTLQDLHETPEGVNVTLTDGGRDTYDMVVAADGIRSALRTRLFGHHEPRYTGHGCWRVTLPRPSEVTYQALYMGVGVKAGLIPLSRETMYLLLVTNEPGNPRIKREDMLPMLHERLQSFDGPVLSSARRQIDDGAAIVYVPIEEVTLPAPWHSGRVVLIGDAAHASSPHIAQGAAMAIEDAVVLAEEAATGAPAADVLDAWMARRYERCMFVQGLSRQIGNDGQVEDDESCRLRNEAITRRYGGPTPKPREHELVLQQPI